MVPRLSLNRQINNDELFDVIKDGMGLSEVIAVEKEEDFIQIWTNWSRFEVRIDSGSEVLLYQRINKDKYIPLILILIISLALWLPLMFLVYKFIVERRIGKRILAKIGKRLNVKVVQYNY